MDTAAPHAADPLRDASVIVLAGGKSTRFGRDKASELLQGETLLQRTVRCLTSLAVEIIVVRAPGEATPVPAHAPRLREVADIYAERGPLGGIYAGLVASASFHNLVVGCDMPFLNLDLIRYLFSIARGFDVVMPRMGGKTEALHAVYSKNCLRPIESLIRRGEFQVIQFLDAVRTRFVEEKEIDLLDSERLSFFNVNSPADLRYAERLAARRGVENACRPLKTQS